MSDKNDGVNSLATGVAGAIIGAAVGAAAVIFSDEKNRNKAGKVLKNMEKEGEKALGEIKKTAVELKNANQEILSEAVTSAPKGKAIKKSD